MKKIIYTVILLATLMSFEGCYSGEIVARTRPGVIVVGRPYSYGFDYGYGYRPAPIIVRSYGHGYRGRHEGWGHDRGRY